jgi:thiol-disulfide isomerase/thioredoxin
MTKATSTDSGEKSLRMRGELALLVWFCLLFVSAAACSSDPPTPTVEPVAATASLSFGPVVGDRAPSFETTLVAGGLVRSNDIIENGLIVNFWATWCAPCIRELPLLDEIAREHATDGLTVLAVNMGEQQEAILEFLDEFDLGFPVALDKQGQISGSYGVLGLPMSFFIDRSGVVRYRRIGELMEDHVARGLERIP